MHRTLDRALAANIGHPFVVAGGVVGVRGAAIAQILAGLTVLLAFAGMVSIASGDGFGPYRTLAIVGAILMLGAIWIGAKTYQAARVMRSFDLLPPIQQQRLADQFGPAMGRARLAWMLGSVWFGSTYVVFGFEGQAIFGLVGTVLLPTCLAHYIFADEIYALDAASRT